MATYSTLGERLRHWRQERGLSQGAFGELLHPKVRHSTVCRWENGVRRPAKRFLRQIIALTAIPADLAFGIAKARPEGQL